MTYLNQSQQSHLRLINKASQTTDTLAGKCGTYEFLTIRAELLGLEQAGYIERSKENGWRWSLTEQGKEILFRGLTNMIGTAPAMAEAR